MNKSDFRQVVGEAVGLASMAWSETPNGVFDDTVALQAVKKVIDASTTDYVASVKEFHQVFEHPINKLGQEQLKIRQLRIKLLFEELKELAEASDCKETFRDLCEATVSDENWLNATDGDNVDHLEELDALCDIQYVLAGKVLTGG